MAIERMGQLREPFETNINLLPIKNWIIFGIFIPEQETYKDNYNFYFNINGEQIKIGKKGVYETDTPIYIKSFSFPTEPPQGTLVEYRIYEEED